MAWMPGVIRKEIPKFQTLLRRVRGVNYHVAASEGPSLYGYFSGAKVCSHFYVRKDGTIEQYVDTQFQAPANLEGNSSLISVETQGGVRNADKEPWTPEQVEANAKIAVWAHKVHGVPLQLMPDSRPTSRGLGWHRLGVDPWRVDGGEEWSSAYGKICPGGAKVAQMPAVRDRAKQILAGEEDDMFTDEDRALLRQIGKYTDTKLSGIKSSLSAQVANIQEGVWQLGNGNIATRNTLMAQIGSVQAALATISVNPNVDLASLAKVCEDGAAAALAKVKLTVQES